MYKKSYVILNEEDVDGQIVLQNSDKKKLDSGSHTIKVLVESLSKGVYLVRININNRVFVKKVIIK